MEASIVLGWIVWAFAAAFLGAWSVGIFKRYVNHEAVGWQPYFPLVWGVAALVITAVTDFSKFHLFWMIPLGVIFLLAILGVQLWLNFKDLGNSFKEMVEQMNAGLEQQKRLYSVPLEMIEAEPEDFSRLDLTWYDEMTKELEDGIGARFVADLEMTTLTEIWPEMRTFVRCLTADEGTLIVAIHNIRACDPEGNLFQDAKTIEFETVFSDGSFLQTSNTEGANFDESCEGIRVRKLPLETSWQETLREHRVVLGQLMSEENMVPTPILTKEDIIEAQKRQHEFRSKAKQEEWDEMEEDFEDFDEEDYEDLDDDD